MNNEDLQASIDSIQEKLGEESSALIADDLGILISNNTKVYNSIQEMNKEITQLKSDKEKLVIANGNLLQQVPMASEYDKHQSSKEEGSKKSFNLKDAFDSKGNFKRG